MGAHSTYVGSYVVAVTHWRVRVCVDSRQWVERVLVWYIHTLREIYAHARDAPRLPYPRVAAFFFFLYCVVSLWYSQRGGHAGESFAMYAPELQTCTHVHMYKKTKLMCVRVYMHACARARARARVCVCVCVCVCVNVCASL